MTEQHARLVMYTQLKKLIAQNIENTAAALSPQQKKILEQKQFDHIISADKKKIAQTVQDIAAKERSQLTTYLLGADSYHFYSLSQNILTQGALSDTIKNGSYFDPLMMAPRGHWRAFELHPYTGVFLYRTLRQIIPKITLITSAAWVPLILFVIIIILYFSMCQFWHIPRSIFLTTGLYLALSPIFLQRSAFGWYDTDPYNVLFPLLIIGILSRMIEDTASLIWSIALAIVTVVYYFFWQGWLLLMVLSEAIIISVMAVQIRHKKPVQRLILQGTSYTIFTLIIGMIFMTPTGILTSFKDIGRIITNFLFVKTAPWPDILIAVGELKASTFIKSIHLLGGWPACILILFGLLACCGGFTQKLSRKHEILIATGFICSFLFAKSAERFVLFLLIPSTCCAAAGLATLHVFIPRILHRLHYKAIHQGAVILVHIILIGTALVYAHTTASHQMPIFNPVWDDTLTQLNKTTPSESIITSWWPPGHFIKAIAHRRVTFDGATLETPPSYWVARLLLATSQRETLGILRMLNTSGNTAVELLTDHGMQLDKAIDLINSLILLDKKTAFAQLSTHIPPTVAQTIIKHTHGTPAPTYLLIYNDLIENTLGLYFVKNWDFTVSEPQKKDISLPFNTKRTGGSIVEHLWERAGGRPYIGKEIYESNRDAKGSIYFSNGVTVNPQTHTAAIHELEGAVSGPPQSVIALENNTLHETTQHNPTLKLSILLLGTKETGYSAIVAPREVLLSTLYRLYYFDGKGLDHFTKIIQEENPLYNTRIMVYRVNWEE